MCGCRYRKLSNLGCNVNSFFAYTVTSTSQFWLWWDTTAQGLTKSQVLWVYHWTQVCGRRVITRAHSKAVPLWPQGGYFRGPIWIRRSTINSVSKQSKRNYRRISITAVNWCLDFPTPRVLATKWPSHLDRLEEWQDNLEHSVETGELVWRWTGFNTGC